MLFHLWNCVTYPDVDISKQKGCSYYFVIFGNLVGSRIGEMGGFSYMQFIVPGLIMIAVITNSYANVSSSFFSA